MLISQWAGTRLRRRQRKAFNTLPVLQPLVQCSVTEEEMEGSSDCWCGNYGNVQAPVVYEVPEWIRGTFESAFLRRGGETCLDCLPLTSLFPNGHKQGFRRLSFKGTPAFPHRERRQEEHSNPAWISPANARQLSLSPPSSNPQSKGFALKLRPPQIYIYL